MQKFLLIFGLLTAGLLGQSADDKEAYELAQMELGILINYNYDGAQTKSLVDTARVYAAQGAYDLALIYLDEAKSMLNQNPVLKPTVIMPSSFSFSLSTGVDYTRQEFEFGFAQNDSLLVDALNNPFLGVELNWNPVQIAQFNLLSRIDKENFINALSFSLTPNWNGIKPKAVLSATVDNNSRYKDLGYTMFAAHLQAQLFPKSTNWYVLLSDYAYLKKYKGNNTVINDFFKNSLSSYVSYNFSPANHLGINYSWDRNKSLDAKRNDYSQQNIQTFFGFSPLTAFSVGGTVSYTHNKFNYDASDNTGTLYYENQSSTWLLNPNLEWRFSQTLASTLEYSINKKSYKQKTEEEPDYTHQMWHPAFLWNVNNFSDISLGVFYEKKAHTLQNGLVEAYILEQNYTSKGVSLDLSYANTSDFMLSLTTQYSLRRHEQVDDTLGGSLYSNRNILSLLLYAQIPFSSKFALNLIGSYDNDKDIDSDFNDSNSSFYTAELKYSF